MIHIKKIWLLNIQLRRGFTCEQHVEHNNYVILAISPKGRSLGLVRIRWNAGKGLLCLDCFWAYCKSSSIILSSCHIPCTGIRQYLESQLPWGEGGLHGRLVLDLPTDPRRGHDFLQPSSTYVLRRISGWRHHHDKNVNNVPILVEGWVRIVRRQQRVSEAYICALKDAGALGASSFRGVVAFL